jgi:hypothetical protein
MADLFILVLVFVLVSAAFAGLMLMTETFICTLADPCRIDRIDENSHRIRSSASM